MSSTVIEMHSLNSTSSIQKKLSRRNRVEASLLNLLNQSKEGWSIDLRRYIESLNGEEFPLAEVSKFFKCQLFILEQLVNILYSSTENNQTIEKLNRTQIGNLICVLNSTIEVRALVFFKMLRGRNENCITKESLAEFYCKYYEGLKIFKETDIKHIIEPVIKKFHLDERKWIDFEEFYRVVSEDTRLFECLSQFKINSPQIKNSSHQASETSNKTNGLCTSLKSKLAKHKILRYMFTRDYLNENLSRIILIFLYLLTSISLMIYVIFYKAPKYNYTPVVIVARIGGILLNFNCALIIVLMLRHTASYIRMNTFLRKWIPVDDHIGAHRFVGYVIIVLSIVHTIAHMANFGTLKAYTWWEYMFTTKPGLGWIGGFASLSGVILLVILAIMVISSATCILGSNHFQIFYWSHLLYLPFYILLIFHAKDFWKWIVGPLTLYMVEKLYSVYARYTSKIGRTYIHSATIEQSNVVSLTIHRPEHFDFKPGDYISINLPRVALYEFHPFTISSSPEDHDYIRVHIKDRGDWTKKVYNRFKGMSPEEALKNNIQIYRADIHSQDTIIRIQDLQQDQMHNDSNISFSQREPVQIKGPYSSCARYVFDCKHVVLIGSGIGITPYASILSSLMAQYRASAQVPRNPNDIYYISKGFHGYGRLQKVDFVWVNPDYKSFEWFLNLLRQFEEEQENYLRSHPNEKRFLDIHLYFTGLKIDKNIDNAPLELVRRIWAEVGGKDIFTSLVSRTNLGRPNWERLFNQFISSENADTADDVSIFFCGRADVGAAIRHECQTFRFRYNEEIF